MSAIKKQKRADIDKILEDNKHAPAQGSAEWLAGRKFTVGGSVMAGIIGKNVPGNKASTIRSLATQKVGLSRFPSKKQMRWGNICEPISRMYTEHVLRTKIDETGAIPGRIKHLKYSPDGLGVVSMSRMEKRLTDLYIPWKRYDGLKEYANVLFEYKNPFSRVPKAGVIPVGYQIQMQTGMYTIENMEMGLFVDSVVRKCKLYDLNHTNTYEAAYFNDKPMLTNDPICYGFMGVCQSISDMIDEENDSEESEESEFDFEDADFLDTLNTLDCSEPSFAPDHSHGFCEKNILAHGDHGEYIDFGNCSEHNFDVMATGVINGRFEAYYTQPRRSGPFRFYQEWNKFLEFCDAGGYQPIGLMPWKLFQLELVPLKKDPNFFKPVYQKRINKLIDYVKQYHDKPTSEKAEALERFFPKYNPDVDIIDVKSYELLKAGGLV